MLKQRVITAVVVVALVLAALMWLSPVNFCLFIAAVVCYGAWEWSSLAGLKQPLFRFVYVGLIALGLWAAAVLIGLQEPVLNLSIAYNLLLSGGLWWLVALIFIGTYPRTESYWKPPFLRALMGYWVLVPAWIAVVVIMKSNLAEELLIMVVAIVALADIGAYFSGKKFGHHKLAVNVSPGKTLEGVLGGLTANIFFAVLIGVILNYQGMQWLWLIMLVIVTSIASVVGDLLESMIKRTSGVKDSGALLPGHGGVLDRVDSYTAALPVFVLILLLSGEITRL